MTKEEKLMLKTFLQNFLTSLETYDGRKFVETDYSISTWEQTRLWNIYKKL